MVSLKGVKKFGLLILQIPHPWIRLQETHNCQVDLAGATLKIGTQIVSLLRPNDGDSLRSGRVVASETVDIPPRSEYLTYGTLEGEVAELWGSVGPVRNTVSRRDILVGGTLVDVRSSKRAASTCDERV